MSCVLRGYLFKQNTFEWPVFVNIRFMTDVMYLYCILLCSEKYLAVYRGKTTCSPADIITVWGIRCTAHQLMTFLGRLSLSHDYLKQDNLPNTTCIFLITEMLRSRSCTKYNKEGKFSLFGLFVLFYLYKK